VQASVTLTVPPRKDQRDERRSPLEHSAVILLTQASEDDGRAVDRLVCMRGNRMEVETRKIGSAQSSSRFTAILLAGCAADQSLEALAAEEFLRAAEPPDHNAWKKTEDLTTVYARGAARRLEDFRRDMIQAVYSATRLTDTPSAEDGPSYLRDLLTLNHPASPRTSGYPTVRRIGGHVDESGAWQIEIEVRFPDRADPWIFAPVLKFVTQSGPHLPAEWAHLEAESGCELIGRSTIRCMPGARTAVIRGASDVASHPVAASMSRATVDLAAVQGVGA
jgi:RNA polymerase primary sigma factor